MEELYADRRIVYKLKKYFICRPKNCLQIEESFADEIIVCRQKECSIVRLKNDLEVKEVFDPQVEEVSLD